MSEIVKEIMLIQVNSTNNNNKFYHVTLDSNGVLTKRWGRVGTDGASSTETGNEASFERVVRAKKNRGYKESGIVSSTTTVSGKNDKLLEVAKTVLSDVRGDTVLDSLIERLVSYNAHQILERSDGLIKVDTAGHITTPLGVVSLASLEEARNILDSIQNPANVSNRVVEDYLRLVPQKVPRKAGWAADFFTTPSTDLKKQRNLLDQLEDSLKWYETEAATQKKAREQSTGDDDLAVKYASLFKYKVSVLDPNGKDFAEIDRLYRKTLYSGHAAAGLKLKRVFVLGSPAQTEAYEAIASKIGNRKQMWHGTSPANVLSILRTGLYCPTKISSGRMFGNGVYLSEMSTKSLNYSYGFWGGRARTRNCFMFLTDVAMGKEYRPVTQNDQYNLSRGRTDLSRYNSINVKAGTSGVRNHEAIVWNTDQVNLRFLCEFE